MPHDRQRHDDRVPAHPAGEPHRDVAELQRSGAIRGVCPVDRRGGQEEAGLEHRDRRGGKREPEIDLPPPDGDRGEMGDECACRDRMREREKRRADRIDGPPHRVPALHRAREERGREEHRRKRHRERLDRTRRCPITPNDDASTSEPAAPACRPASLRPRRYVATAATTAATTDGSRTHCSASFQATSGCRTAR